MSGHIAKAKAALPLPMLMHRLARSGEMNQPRTKKRAPAVVGDLMLGSALKTRPRAEGGSKKGQFCRPLPKEFQRFGFNYRQIAREGDIAIYEQVWAGCAEPSRS